MHAYLARRRVYLHLTRWTSLGLSLIEAMHMGCPIVGLATTEAVTAVPSRAGVLSTNVAELVDAARYYLDDHDAARRAGAIARRAATQRFGLARFLADWDRLLADVTAQRPALVSGGQP
jgi:glycosyltransferase involved in cell wall biosynthesis